MQVPGPPRWGAYGAPADQQYQQYMAGGARMQAGVMPPGTMRWRPSAQLQPGMRAGGMQHFNPAPGPPPGKGGRAGMANGTRQDSAGMMHEAYASSGHGQAMMFNPFMMQHPLMMPQQQAHGSPWGAAGMMQQQVRAARPGGVRGG